MAAIHQTTSRAAPLERILTRERAIVLGALMAVTALAWVYLIDMADMDDVSEVMAAAMRMAPWDATGFVLMFLMWVVMMVGMMLPGAAPMILLYATINRRKRAAGSPYAPTAVFALGYVTVWTAFSLLATLMQGVLQHLTWLSPMLVSTSHLLGGALLIGAGLYQWTPLKRACLDTCRSPLSFILMHWRSGVSGALYMGMVHGVYCLGCCGLLMGLLFVGGVMNLLWVAAITLLVLGEKLVPGGGWFARISGAAMIAVGIWFLSA
jgi:predicted metal-binding membrane protein